MGPPLLILSPIFFIIPKIFSVKFQVILRTDVKQTRSRVKARVTPSVQAISMAAAPVQASTEECPPPTSIQDLQQVGIRCGIAPDDLSEDKLLAAQQTASDEAADFLYAHE